MKKFYEKQPVWFAVVWIIAYVVGFSLADGLGEALGLFQLPTVLLGLVMTAGLLIFATKNGLMKQLGLCKSNVPAGKMLFYIPLFLIVCANVWKGFGVEGSPWAAVTGVVCMILVGFLEEVIFRGLLFKAMSREGLTSAIIVSSLTFGIGHIVNLLNGAPVFETLLQLVYASAVGFCFTAVFHISGSILYCIAAHSLVNSLSVFTPAVSPLAQILEAALITAVSVGFGLWLLLKRKKA